MKLFILAIGLAVLVFAWLRSIKYQVDKHHGHRTHRHNNHKHNPTPSGGMAAHQ